MSQASYFNVKSTQIRCANPAQVVIRYNYTRGMRVVGQVDVALSEEQVDFVERVNHKVYRASFTQLTAQILLYNFDIHAQASVGGKVAGTLLEVANTPNPTISTRPPRPIKQPLEKIANLG